MPFSPSGPGFESCVYSNPSSIAYERDFANAVSSQGLIIRTTKKVVLVFVWSTYATLEFFYRIGSKN